MSEVSSYIEALNALNKDLAQSGRTGLLDTALVERRFLALEYVNLRSVYESDGETILTTPGTDANELGYVPGTHGTNTPLISTSDATGASIAEKCRFQSVVPQLDGDIYLAILASIQAAAAVATTIDIAVFQSDGAGGIDPAATDLYSGAAVAVTTTLSWLPFRINASNITIRGTLDVLITATADDTAGANDCDIDIGAIAWVHLGASTAES